MPGKVYSSVLLNRIKTAADEKIREEQAGFRSGRSCIEQIFTLRNIIEQCNEYRKPLHINFVDFQKAFDSVHRETLWSIVKHYGVTQKFVNIFRNIYQNTSCCLRTDTGYSKYFRIETGVRQGCMLSPLLFL